MLFVTLAHLIVTTTKKKKIKYITLLNDEQIKHHFIQSWQYFQMPIIWSHGSAIPMAKKISYSFTSE